MFFFIIKRIEGKFTTLSCCYGSSRWRKIPEAWCGSVQRQYMHLYWQTLAKLVRHLPLRSVSAGLGYILRPVIWATRHTLCVHTVDQVLWIHTGNTPGNNNSWKEHAELLCINSKRPFINSLHVHLKWAAHGTDLLPLCRQDIALSLQSLLGQG